MARVPLSPEAPWGDVTSQACMLVSSAMRRTRTVPTALRRLQLSSRFLSNPDSYFQENKTKQNMISECGRQKIKITRIMANIYPVHRMHRGMCSLSSKTNRTDDEPCPVVQVQSETGVPSCHSEPCLPCTMWPGAGLVHTVQ